MSDVKNDGGPAFSALDPRKYDAAGDLLPRGMSLRDWFAGQCDVSAYAPVDAFATAYGRTASIGELAEYIAAIRYIEADAMLAERSK